MDYLPSQVSGESTDLNAICQWPVTTSPCLNPLDASTDSGLDICAGRQPYDIGEPTGKVFSQTLERSEKSLPNL